MNGVTSTLAIIRAFLFCFEFFLSKFGHSAQLCTSGSTEEPILADSGTKMMEID